MYGQNIHLFVYLSIYTIKPIKYKLMSEIDRLRTRLKNVQRNVIEYRVTVAETKDLLSISSYLHLVANS